MPKKSGHEVVLHRLRMHINSHQSAGDVVYDLLIHSSAIMTLCAVLKEMFIPEEERLHVANQLLSLLLECNAQNTDADLIGILTETLPEIERGYEN